MLQALRDLLLPVAFMPHGHCYLWEPALVWLQVLSNAAIGLSYVAIAATLAYLVKKGRYLPFQGMAIAFGLFIVSCGVTHFFDVIVIWYPAYWLDGTVRAITAVASVTTALFLPGLVPRAIELARGARAMQERGVALATALDDLGRLYERTKEVERLKTELFANVSHELRTPLTLMLGPAERLLAGGALEPAQRRDVELIVHNGRVLLEHVNDLLDAARLEAGRFAPTYARVELDRLVRRVAACFDGLAGERGIAYPVEVPPSLHAEVDPDELGRVLLNLLSNAFRHTPPGGTVRCTASIVEAEGGERIRLEVADSGPGIAPEHRARVFERFVQGDGPARQGGTGLGLAIAKDFVELHGGTIEVSDAPEGGARFVVELPRSAPPGTSLVPLAEPAASPLRLREHAGPSLAPPASLATLPSDRPRSGGLPSAEPPAGAPASPERPRVLVVEDNPEMNRFVCESLAPELCTESAFDGREGLARALARRPDLVVSDVMMPHAGGEELVAGLRERPELDAVPILLLTARTDEELRVRMLERGAQDYLAKPFSAAELRVRAGNLVAMKRARDVLQEALGHRGRDLEALAQELTRRRAELQLALERAEEGSRLKTDFLRLVSHELRSPLATLQLQLERLEAELGGAAPGRLARRMLGSIARLRELIDGLLRYSRTHGGPLPVRAEPIDVPALCRAVLDEQREQAQAKDLVLRVEAAPELPALRSDLELVRLVLGNLVSNAVKFTAAGRVTVRVERSGDAHRIAVHDTGPGIPAAARERVFAPFEQLEPVRRKHAVGVGLGLALVREMVRALDGSIALESEVGVGSTFTVVLPDRG